MKYKIPHVIHLPFGYNVTVHQLGNKAFRMQYNTVFGDSDSDGAAAFFIPKENASTIILNKNRTWIDRRDDLIHELSHVMVEYGEYIKTLK